MSDEGIKQAKTLAEKIREFKPDKIYSSKLKRAVQTAEILSREINLPIEKLEELNERGFGEFEGKPWQEIVEELNRLNKTMLSHTPKGGENHIVFYKRAVKIFKKLLKKHEGETVLVVTHGGIILSVIKHLKNLPIDKEIDANIRNASICIFKFENDILTEEVIGNIDHLRIN